MRTRLLLGTAGLGAVALVATTALPASAADGDTTVTFALSGSTLSVAVAGAAGLSNAATGAASVSGQLGQVQVTDLRGSTVNWNTRATSTAFTTGTLPNGNPTSTAVSYDSGAITTTGTIVIAPKGARSLNSTPTQVAAPTAVVGNNTATWNPTLTVSLPSDALAGDYTGTVNTSVL